MKENTCQSKCLSILLVYSCHKRWQYYVNDFVVASYS